MDLNILMAIILMVLAAKSNSAYIENEVTTDSLTKCDRDIEQIEREHRAILTENDSNRLYYMWFSKHCEASNESEYMIRKYRFFKNGTTLLIRYHYVDESCSIPKYSVTILGSIKLLGPSLLVSGAIETKFHVHVIYITALSRQIAKNFGRQLNATCGPQPKWRIYRPQLIYENFQVLYDSSLFNAPRYNSLPNQSSMNKLADTKCFKTFGIEFNEFSMLRVQIRPYGQKTNTDHSFSGTHIELLLANPVSYTYSQSNHSTKYLQSTVLLRADTIKDCVICNSISRSNAYSPPIVHKEVILPPFIGGSWLSDRCESCEGGIWTKKQVHLYSGDKLWNVRWDYYLDPRCSKSLYSVLAAGTYVLKSERRKSNEKSDKRASSNYFHVVDTFKSSLFKRSITTSIIPNDVYTSDQANAAVNNIENQYALNTQMNKQSKEIPQLLIYNKNPMQDKIPDSNKMARTMKRSLSDNYYQQSEQSMIETRLKAMMRGNQEYETSTKRPISSEGFFITELSLYVIESKLIPKSEVVSGFCGVNETGVPLIRWPRNCVPHTIETPSTLKWKVKLTTDWHGNYLLHLGSPDNTMWQNPLRHCSEEAQSWYNPILKAHLEQSIVHNYGLLSSASIFRLLNLFFISQLLLLCYIIR